MAEIKYKQEVLDEVLETSAKTPLKGKIVYGSPEDFGRNPIRTHWHSLFSKNPALLVPPFHDGLLMPYFRQLKSILTAPTDQSKVASQTILLTSVLPNEGVTTVAFNLAASFSLSNEYTTILIDCCTGNHNLTTQLGASHLRGLLDYLEGQCEIPAILNTLPVPQLMWIPYGNRHPCRSELFQSNRMKLLIETLTIQYPDCKIILDTPSSQLNPDSKILSQFADTILLVTQLYRTPQRLLEKTTKMFEQPKIAGVIANRASLIPKAVTKAQQ